MMKVTRRDILKYGSVVVLGGATSTVFGGGVSLPDQDAFATARGEAFAATADNPSAVFYNPAGITQLSGGNVRGGVYGIYLDPSFSSSAGNFDNKNKLHAIPQLFSTYTLKNAPITFGLGVYSPFGTGLEWDQNTGFRTVTGGLKSSLTCFTFNPVVAVKLSPQLSVAAGLSANYANLDLKQGILATPDNDSFEFKGDGWAVGYNFGALWQPCKKLSFGGTFRGQANFNLEGNTYANVPLFGLAYHSDASTSLSFPIQAVVGVSYRPTPEWNLEFDAEYTDWDKVQSLTIDQPGAVGLPSSLPVALDWQSSWFFEWGATRYLTDHWQVSAGFVFNENSIPTAHYTPAVADMNKYFFSIGTGYKWKQFDVDVAYQFGYGTRTVSGSEPSAAGQTADGNYEFISHAVIASAGWHF